MGGSVMGATPPEQEGMSPEDLDAMYRAQQAENERRRAVAMNEIPGETPRAIMPAVIPLIQSVSQRPSSEVDAVNYILHGETEEEKKKRRQHMRDLADIMSRMGMAEDDVPVALLPRGTTPSF